jgi:hypothetical protein
MQKEHEMLVFMGYIVWQVISGNIMQGIMTSIRILLLLCLLLLTVISHAQPLQLRISIEETAQPEQQWQVTYEFSQSINAISFAQTPYPFIEHSWDLISNQTSLDLSSLTVVSESAIDSLKVGIKDSYDEFIRGFYTPFLNFSDGSHAVYLGHFVPARVQIGSQWFAVDDMLLTMKLKGSDGDQVYGIEPPESALSQLNAWQRYAYVGSMEVHSWQGFQVILDPALPDWIKQTHQQLIPLLADFYARHTGAELGFEPMIMINFKPGDQYPRQDGGVINQQLLINMVGDGWAQNPEANRMNVQSLLAHEMAHFWNSQHWQLADHQQYWLSEGGADYFSHMALHKLGYFTADELAAHIRQLAQSCQSSLQQHTISQLPSRADAYVCGELMYHLAARITESDHPLGVWPLMAAVNEHLRYSEQTFIEALRIAGAAPQDVQAMQNITEGSARQSLNTLIDRYVQ